MSATTKPRSAFGARADRFATVTLVNCLFVAGSGLLGCGDPDDGDGDSANQGVLAGDHTSTAGSDTAGPGSSSGPISSPPAPSATGMPPSTPGSSMTPSMPSMPPGTGGTPGVGGIAGSDGGAGPVVVPGSGGSSAGSSSDGGAGPVAGAGGAAGGSSPVPSGGSSAGGSGVVGGAGGTSGGASSTGGGGVGGAAPEDMCPPAEPPPPGGMEICSNARGNAGGGFGYELWAEGTGSGCMTVYGDQATFGAEWNDVEDFLARVGLDFDQTRTHTQIGTIYADFAETHTGSEEGLTYVGIYGWTVNPLREFYILDDWGAEKPGGFSSDGTPRDEVGTIEVDGETYDVWKKTRENKPAITGDNMTFDQYFSIRRTARKCGRISVSEHFSKWEEFGLPLGNLYEVKLLLESQFNSGSIVFTTANVVVE